MKEIDCNHDIRRLKKFYAFDILSQIKSSSIIYYTNWKLLQSRGTVDKWFSKLMFLKISQYSRENTCVGISFWKICRPKRLQLYRKDTPTQVLSIEYCKIFKNSFFIEHLRRLPLSIFMTTTVAFFLMEFHMAIITWFSRSGQFFKGTFLPHIIHVDS